MSWRPLVATDTGSKSQSEQSKQLSEVEFRTEQLALLSGIRAQLDLLNARVEEAFDTKIQETDI